MEKGPFMTRLWKATVKMEMALLHLTPVVHGLVYCLPVMMENQQYVVR
jgi:hypothetical protein